MVHKGCHHFFSVFGVLRVLKNYWNLIEISSDFNFIVASWFLCDVQVKPIYTHSAPGPLTPTPLGPPSCSHERKELNLDSTFLKWKRHDVVTSLVIRWHMGNFPRHEKSDQQCCRLRQRAAAARRRRGGGAAARCVRRRRLWHSSSLTAQGKVGTICRVSQHLLHFHQPPVNLNPIFLFWKNGFVCYPEKKVALNLRNSYKSEKKSGVNIPNQKNLRKHLKN